VDLDGLLARQYGVRPSHKAEYDNWRTTHQPFHWFVQFYGIMAGGGFDVVIGNPPWREYAVVKKEYTVRGYTTETCGNLHGICTERAVSLRSPSGRVSFIVQLPLASSSRMATVRRMLRTHSRALHVIPFDDRPGKLFEGLQHCRSVIFLSTGAGSPGRQLFATSKYQRWATEARPVLFERLEYAPVLAPPLFPDQFPKYASTVEDTLFSKTSQEATQYWVKATVGLPYYAKNGAIGAPDHGRALYFENAQMANAACALMNSSLFYAYFIAYSDCFHLSDTLVSSFPVSRAALCDPELASLNHRLMAELRKNAGRRTIQTRDHDEITYDEFFVGKSKPILDEIDRTLAQHYGFTDTELDFVVNYDIKYRMGTDED
jgi:hypothetical protein